MWPLRLENIRYWVVVFGVSGLLVGFMLGRVFPAKYTAHRFAETYLFMILNENTGEISAIYNIKGENMLGKK